MKLHLFVTAALAAAAVSAPAFAAEPVGSVGLSAAHTNLDLGPINAEGDSYTLDGSVVLPSAGPWDVTLGAAVVSTDDGLNDDTVASGNLALTYAGSDWRAGGFVGAGETGGETLWAVGGVAQKHIGDVTLVGTAGYGKVDGIDADLWGARGDVRYFVSDNFRLNAGVGVARIDGSGANADLWTLGAGGEYQFAGTNWSVFGGYDRTEANDLDLTADTVKIGVRFGFGGDLKARDRSGADLGGAQALFGALQ